MRITNSSKRCGNRSDKLFKITHWNIEGLNKKKEGPKVDDPVFLSQIRGSDIICLTETHAEQDGGCEIEGYHSFQCNRVKHPKAK